MDGIDAVLVDLSTHAFIAGHMRPYSTDVKSCLNAVLSGELTDLKAFSQLNTLLGREFAKAALELMAKANVSSTAIKAIGSHGQTLCHDATADIPYTVQLACAHTIAELTGVTVVADFRTRDLIVGGQGAPFAPLYHQALFKGQEYPLAVINIGGIANISYLSNEFTVRGYDLGPGNCLMDAWIHYQLDQDYDKNGAWAASGKVIKPLLEKLLTDPYFNQKPPKSIGKEYFSLEWLATHLSPAYAPVDVQATLLMLTASVIVQELKKETKRPVRALFCGGGVHNRALLDLLAALLPEVQITSTQALGIDPDYVEAMMLAWLAEKTLTNTSLDLKPITGAKHATILGAIYPAGIDKGNWLRV